MKKFLTYTLLFVLLAAVKPSVAQPIVQITHTSYDSYYDLSAFNPAVVVWYLDYEDFKGNMKPSTRRFKTDTKLPRPRVKDEDLKGTGYVRGHLCPAGDRDTRKDLLKETYLTSNMTPMTMVCNSGPWKMVEDTCRVLAKRHGKIKIAAGTIFLDDSLGVENLGRIKVPAAFFRVARCVSHPEHQWIWIVQNSKSSSSPVRVSTSTLQQVLQNRSSVISALKIENLID